MSLLDKNKLILEETRLASFLPLLDKSNNWKHHNIVIWNRLAFRKELKLCKKIRIKKKIEKKNMYYLKLVMIYPGPGSETCEYFYQKIGVEDFFTSKWHNFLTILNLNLIITLRKKSYMNIWKKQALVNNLPTLPG